MISAHPGPHQQGIAGVQETGQLTFQGRCGKQKNSWKVTFVCNHGRKTGKEWKTDRIKKKMLGSWVNRRARPGSIVGFEKKGGEQESNIHGQSERKKGRGRGKTEEGKKKLVEGASVGSCKKNIDPDGFVGEEASQTQCLSRVWMKRGRVYLY